MKLTNLFSQILTGMCLAICLTACEKNYYYTEVTEEADNEEIPMRDLHVEALSQSWCATRGYDYISPLFAYLAPSISNRNGCLSGRFRLPTHRCYILSG